MNDLGEVLFIAAVVLGLCIVLPIVAIVRTSKIKGLEHRLAGVEAALLRMIREQGAPAPLPVEAQPVEAQAPVVEAPPAPLPVQPAPATLRVEEERVEGERVEGEPAEHLEAVIGQKWLGWVAIVLIFSAAAFFLKYAFDNRWIGELGRVTLGMVTGIAFAWAARSATGKAGIIVLSWG